MYGNMAITVTEVAPEGERQEDGEGRGEEREGERARELFLHVHTAKQAGYPQCLGAWGMEVREAFRCGHSREGRSEKQATKGTEHREEPERP